MGFFQSLFGGASNQEIYTDTSKFVILDVRTPGEFSEQHVKGAKNIDVMSGDFQSRIQKLDKDAIYKVYCRSGGRSGNAVQMMKSMGFKDVENIGGLQQALQRLPSK